MIGDRVAIVPLRSFIEEGAGEIDVATRRAKTAAISALGYIVNKSKSESAFTYLAQGLNPNVWEARKVQWILPGESTFQRNLVMAKASSLGLGLSGTPEAEQVLVSTQFQISSAGEADIKNAVAPVIENALEINRAVQRLGLKNYELRLQNK